jgi:hypothetical protein
MNAKDLAAKVGRLDALAQKLTKKIVLWGGEGPAAAGPGPRADLTPTQDTRAGVESARAVLAVALHRLEQGDGSGPELRASPAVPAKTDTPGRFSLATRTPAR